MMDFFKNNPAALMDALPTPPGSDDGGEVENFNKSFMSSKSKNNQSAYRKNQQDPLAMSLRSKNSKNNMRYKSTN